MLMPTIPGRPRRRSDHPGVDAVAALHHLVGGHRGDQITQGDLRGQVHRGHRIGRCLHVGHGVVHLELQCDGDPQRHRIRGQHLLRSQREHLLTHLDTHHRGRHINAVAPRLQDTTQRAVAVFQCALACGNGDSVEREDTHVVSSFRCMCLRGKGIPPPDVIGDGASHPRTDGCGPQGR